MKLNEILLEMSASEESTLKSKDWDSITDLEKWLESEGYSLVGQGNFSKVFRKGLAKRVVKVTVYDDDCWRDYAQYAMSVGVSNPYVLKISWLRHVAPEDTEYEEKFMISVLESLIPFNNDTLDQVSDPACLAGIILLAVDEITPIDPDVDPITLQMLENRYEELEGNVDYDEMREKYRNHRFVRTLKTILTKSDQSRCRIDMFADNFMIRESDGRIVVVDPLASENSEMMG
jgi:hypothetical protein